jgi:predicted SPOUT superfamily RNA methylase MTH1
VLLQVVVIDEQPSGDGTISSGAAFLARILQYQETPQYLRKCVI